MILAKRDGKISRYLPAWWNWQTRGTQNPVVAIPCGFDPRRRHQKLFKWRYGMKNRKAFRFAVLLLVFCLILGACASKQEPAKTAYELVSEAVKKTSGLESAEV